MENDYDLNIETCNLLYDAEWLYMYSNITEKHYFMKMSAKIVDPTNFKTFKSFRYEVINEGNEDYEGMYYDDVQYTI